MHRVLLVIVAASLAAPILPATPALANHNGYYHGKTWRDSQGRLRCRRANGTVGIIVGGSAGALSGQAGEGAGGQPSTPVVGPAVGALSGREVATSRRRCR